MDRIQELQTIAALYCEGMGPADIGTLVGITEREARRRIEEAEEEGFLRYAPQLAADRVSSEAKRFAANEALTHALSKVLRDDLKLVNMPVTVTQSPPAMFTTFRLDVTRDSEPYERYQQAELRATEIVSRRAAEIISRILFDGREHTIGLNWGTAVKATIVNINPPPGQIGDAAISVVSLFGDLEFHLRSGLPHSGHVNCNYHVAELAKRLGYQATSVPLNVPGFIPEEFARDPQTLGAIRNFMGGHSSYKRIFGSLPADNPHMMREGMGIANAPGDFELARMDTILTGFGSADVFTDLHNYLRSWLSEAEIRRLLEYRDQDKIIGDIGGYLIEHTEARTDPELRGFLAAVNGRLLAARPADFCAVAGFHRERPGSGGGVVGVTVGARKAQIIGTLLSWGPLPCPISELVIDSHCALALLNLISPRRFRAFRESPAGIKLFQNSWEWSAATLKLIPALEF